MVAGNLYESIADVQDETTRRVLYRQFISKYYPEAYEVITNIEENACIGRLKKEGRIR